MSSMREWQRAFTYCLHSVVFHDDEDDSIDDARSVPLIVYVFGTIESAPMT